MTQAQLQARYASAIRANGRIVNMSIQFERKEITAEEIPAVERNAVQAELLSRHNTRTLNARLSGV